MASLSSSTSTMGTSLPMLSMSYCCGVGVIGLDGWVHIRVSPHTHEPSSVRFSARLKGTHPLEVAADDGEGQTEEDDADVGEEDGEDPGDGAAERVVGLERGRVDERLRVCQSIV